MMMAKDVTGAKGLTVAKVLMVAKVLTMAKVLTAAKVMVVGEAVFLESCLEPYPFDLMACHCRYRTAWDTSWATTFLDHLLFVLVSTLNMCGECVSRSFLGACLDACIPIGHLAK